MKDLIIASSKQFDMVRATKPQSKIVSSDLLLKDIVFEALLNWFHARDLLEREDHVFTMLYYNNPLSDEIPTGEYGMISEQMIEGICHTQDDEDWGQDEIKEYAGVIRPNISTRTGLTQVISDHLEGYHLMVITESAEEMFISMQPYESGQEMYSSLPDLQMVSIPPYEPYDWIDWVLPLNLSKR